VFTCRIAWCPAGESHCVRPPDGAMLDRGIALRSLPHCMVPGRWLGLCYPAGWHGVQPRDCTVFGHRRNGDFCDMRTHVRPGAVGVSPPWFGHTIAVSGEANAVQRRANTRPGAAGVSPPWLGDTIAVSGEANAVQRRANTRPGATFVSPPWLGKRICRYASAKSPESGNGALTNPNAVAVANPRGANAPRSWLHGVRSPRKWQFLRYANARSEERRALARRGSVIRSLCREKRMLFSDERIHTQERRSSARRGSGWANVVHNVLETHLHSR
jgi:hypothetical protein